MSNVADLLHTRKNEFSEEIARFYAYKPPEYAIYQTESGRVLVQYADDVDRANQQRQGLAQLAALRGEIVGLIDGWHDGTTHGFFGLENTGKLKAKAALYERRVADALVVALERDVPVARDLLERIKQDILNERVAWARFEYLIAAIAGAITLTFLGWLIVGLYPEAVPPINVHPARWTYTGTILILLIFFIGLVVRLDGRSDDKVSRRVQALLLFAIFAVPIAAFLICPMYRFGDIAKGYGYIVDLWSAAAAGGVGAFFSIAIGIRGRTVLPDLLRTSNIMDAFLRVTIGFIGGGVLLALVKTKVVNFQIGNASMCDADALQILILGFMAGFSERLVPDLLEHAKFNGDQKSSTSAHVDGIPPNNNGVAPGNSDSSGASLPANAAADAGSDHETSDDCCSSGAALQAHELTPDTELPPASGGIAPAGQGATQ